MAQANENAETFSSSTNRMEYSVSSARTIKYGSRSATNGMEWASAIVFESGINYENHSTPIRYRPPPISSPNLSSINTPHQDEVNDVTRRLALLNLN